MPSERKKSKSSKKRTSRSKKSSSDSVSLEDEALAVVQGASPKKRRRSKSGSDSSSVQPDSVDSSAAPKKRKKKTSSKKKTPSKSSSKRRKSKKRNSKSTKGWSRSAIVFWRFVLSALFGTIFGVGFCGYATYVAAQYDVQQWIVPTNTVEATQPARFLSEAYSIEPKTALPLDNVVDLLQVSGYSKADFVEEPGDFQVRQGSIVIDNRLPHTSIQERVEVFFDAKGVVDIVNQQGRKRSAVLIAPAVLATRKSETSTRERVPYDQIPEMVPTAILAVEDSRFYQHEGLDYIGLTRAVVVNLILDKKSQGASTITQQLVKNLILNNPEKTYKRKAREALRSLALEERLTKKELIELYMNEVYLGQVNGRPVVGVSKAAQVYFGKQVQRLSIGESAMIAGIISAPNAYSPSRHPERALKRRNIALKRLLAVSAINQETYEKELAKPLNINLIPERKRASYFVDSVSDIVEQEIGEGKIAAYGLQVSTSLNPVLQKILERNVSEQIKQLETKHPSAVDAQVAAAILDAHTGEVKALIGGRDYATSQFNRALYANRQVGSLSKPLLYAKLFQTRSDLSPGCWVQDQALEVAYEGVTWKPENYDHQYLQQVTFRAALDKSRNIPAVEVYQYLQQQLGMDFFVEMGAQLDLEIGTRPAASLGAFDANVVAMASAYTLFSNGGQWREASWVSDLKGREQESVSMPKPRQGSIIKPVTAWMVTDMMRTVVEDGTARKARALGVEGAVAAKTGTTNQGRDAWLVGFDSKYVMAVWVGHDKGTPLGLGGSQAALPIWAAVMSEIHPNRPTEFPIHNGVVRKTVCSVWEECAETSEDWFLRGTYRSEQCALFEFESAKESIVERLIPDKRQSEKQTEQESESSDENGFFRLFPWGRKNK